MQKHLFARLLRRGTVGLAVVAAATVLPAATANILEDWQFNDGAGKTLLEIANSGTDGHSSWNATLGSSLTTDRGTFRIQRAIGETSAVYAGIWQGSTYNPIWLVVELEGWAFSQKEGGLNEDLRFGFVHQYTPSLNQFAEMRLGRSASTNEVYLHGIAELRSGGATWIPPHYLGLSNVEERPLTLVLKIDQTAQEYSIFYNLDGAGFAQLGTGNLDSFRQPNYIRFVSLNSFADRMDPDDPESPMEYVEVSRIYMTTTDPVGPTLIDPLPTPGVAAEKILHDWHFNEPAGTTLSGTGNSVGDIQWRTYSGNPADDIGNSSTTGDGAFRIQRAIGGGQTNLAYIDRQWSGKQWFVVDFRGWFFNTSEGSANEIIQMGFIDNYTTSAATMAEFRLTRDSSNPNAVFLGGRAFEAINGAELIPDEALFPTEQTEPVRVVLEFDATEYTYNIHYRIGDGDYILLGEGVTDPVRGPNALRFYASNSFAEPGEFVDVERVFLTTVNPMLPVEGGYAGWAEQHFPGGGPDAEPGADPDGDGIENLVEYALGLDPHTADLDGLPVMWLHDAGTGGKGMSISFRRNPEFTDLVYSVDASDDLLSWTQIAFSAGGAPTVREPLNSNTVVSETDSGDWKIVTVRDAFPTSARDRRFLRLRVEFVAAP